MGAPKVSDGPVTKLHANTKDIRGERFGRLVVLNELPVRERSSTNGKSLLYWRCECDCGNTTRATANALLFGEVQSCGCLRDEKARQRNFVHGRSKTPEHNTWTNMLQRCYNHEDPRYRLYGARGITVCDRWTASFAAFFEDVGARPGPGYSLDRMNTDGNYEPGNVRWATQRTQANNMRVNHRLTHQGRTQTLADWAREVGLPPSTLSNRLQRGWSVEDALATPLQVRPTPPSLTFHGRTQTLAQWARKHGLGYKTLSERLRLGWSIEDALTRPVRRRPRRRAQTPPSPI